MSADLRFATVTAITGLGVIADDLDTTAGMNVDVWVPAAAPAVNDRVLYQIVAGQVCVIANVTSPTRLWGVTLTMAVSVANTAVSQHVTFPTGFFPTAPRVLAELGTGTANPSTTNTETWTTNLNNAGFDANFNRSSTTSCTVRWVAVLA